MFSIDIWRNAVKGTISSERAGKGFYAGSKGKAFEGAYSRVSTQLVCRNVADDQATEGKSQSEG